MGALGRACEALYAWRVEWRAARLRDPVAKLRYLRRSPVAAGRRRALFPPPGAVAALTVLLAPVPTASDACLAPGSAEAVTAERPPLEVWLVEEQDGVEHYSNGLRIESRPAVAGSARRYPVYDAESLELLEWRDTPAGIVFHTTESHMAPFRPELNPRLRRVGRWMLDYVRQRRAYHFVVDRFGRVHRIVREQDGANHAGASLWAAGGVLFVNLNSSFLGVAFETQTPDPARGAELTSAQIAAGRLLVEMLRVRHGIPESNCVTHAQVSVAPSAMVLGNHLDWSANFPFEALGLADNYGLPAAAVAIFGFGFDRDFQQATRQALGRGLALGEELFRRRARLLGRSEARHRAAVERRYREIIQALRNHAGAKEDSS